MIFFDSIILGFFYFLDGVSYRNSKEESFGPREHAFLLSWFVHSLNLHQICNFLERYYKFIGEKNFVFLVVTVALVINYVIYIRRGRLNTLINNHVPRKRKILYVVITFLYLVSTVFFYLR